MKIINNLTVYDRISRLNIRDRKFKKDVIKLINTSIDDGSRIRLSSEFITLKVNSYLIHSTVHLLCSSYTSQYINSVAVSQVLSILSQSTMGDIKLDPEVVVTSLIDLIDPVMSMIIPIRVVLLILYDIESTEVDLSNIRSISLTEILIQVRDEVKSYKRSENDYNIIYNNLVNYLVDDEINRLMLKFSDHDNDIKIKWVDKRIELVKDDKTNPIAVINAVREYISAWKV